MPRGIKRYQGNPFAMFGPLYNAPDDTGGGGGPAPTAPKGAPPGNGGAADDKPDEKLGEGGMKALESEREKRKELEQTVAQMKSAQEAQTAALAEALGVKVDKKQDGTEVVAALQKQVEEMQREAAINRIARDNGITDAEDIALIGEARSEDAMSKVAARLKTATTAIPKPDGSQGPKGDEVKPDVKPGRSRLAAGVTEALEKS